MTVKELLQRKPFPSTLVGIYIGDPQADSSALTELFIGPRAEAIESRYADIEVLDWTEAYHMQHRKVGIIVYIADKEVTK